MSNLKRKVYLSICNRNKKLYFTAEDGKSHKSCLFSEVEKLIQNDDIIRELAGGFKSMVLTIKEDGRNIDIDDDTEIDDGSDVSVDFVLPKNNTVQLQEITIQAVQENPAPAPPLDEQRVGENILELTEEEAAMLQASDASIIPIELQLAPATSSSSSHKKFVLPARYKKEVESVIDLPMVMNDSCRNAAIRTIADTMYAVEQYPSLEDYRFVARMAIEKHPGLRTHYGNHEKLLVKQLQNRMQRNRRAPKRPNPDATTQSKPKRGRRRERTLLFPGQKSAQGPQVTDEDNAVYEDHVKKLKDENSSIRKRPSALLLLQKSTFRIRRERILSGLLLDVLQECPTLDTANALLEELCLICDKNVGNKMDENWRKVSTRILKLAKIQNSPSSASKDVLEAYDESDKNFEDISTAALFLLPTLLSTRQKIVVNKYLLETYEEGTATFEEIANKIDDRKNPFIIKIGSAINVAFEKRPFVAIPTGKIGDAIQIMMAIYYAFNVAYPSCLKLPLLFIQAEIMGRKDSASEKAISIKTLSNTLSALD